MEKIKSENYSVYFLTQLKKINIIKLLIVFLILIDLVSNLEKSCLT